jgi:uncharacterized FlaG/YvyC family protein
MDTQALNASGNQTVPPTHKQSSSSSEGSKTDPKFDSKVLSDKVELSSKAKVLVETKNKVQVGTNDEQRKFLVTDDNDIILKVIDRKTQKVVKSVPSEKEIQLKNAVRDGVSNITE